MRKAHPADEHGPSLFVDERLAGVVVKAVVPVDEGSLVDAWTWCRGIHALRVKVKEVSDASLQREVSGRMHALRRHALGVVGIV